MCCCECCRKCCTVTQKKIWVYGLGTVFLALGITMVIIWPEVSQNILISDFVLQEGTENYEAWQEAPIPIYLEFYLWNWTNPEEIRNPNVKPHFVEMGPYVYLEKHFKDNITFYPNNSISYYEKRTWFFDAERSNGTEDDMVTAAHVITAAVADQMRHRNKITKKIINFMLNREGGELYTTQKAGEWIFYGYQDNLTDFLNLFNTTKINIPYTRFGWLADRNESLAYDGQFTIHSGVGDIMQLGSLSHWNGRGETGFYEMPCGKVNGTTGDVFHPRLDPKAEITIFATDACRYMNLQPEGTMEHYGMEAVRWVGKEETFDSGVNYPEQACFCNPEDGECPKAGVVECKKCRDNAPIYASFPHFFLADQSYVDAVGGMNPNKEEHEFVMGVNAEMGVPLRVNARLQINMMIEPDDDYDIYRGVPKVLMPMFWFEQKAYLSEELTHRTKLASNLDSYGKWFGIIMIVVGAILFIVGIALTLTKSWSRTPQEDEDMLSTN